MTDLPKIAWTRELALRLKKAHRQAIKEKQESFVFDGYEFVPAYAGYLLEYLSLVLKFPFDREKESKP